MTIFYAPDIKDNNDYQLSEKESHHAIHVLRLKINDTIQLTDGVGNMYNATIHDIKKKYCSVVILNSVAIKKNWPNYLHIAIAPTKSTDRFDFFLEKACEIGIDEITPILTENSERRTLNIEKENQVLIAAMKQSGKATLPKLNDVVDYKTFIKKYAYETGLQKFICHCRQSEKNDLSLSYKPDNNVLVLIGPEGDFSEQEIIFSKINTFESVSLGSERLRTETAGIQACSIFHFINK